MSIQSLKATNVNDILSLASITRAVIQQMLDGLLSQPARTIRRRVEFEAMKVMAVISMACQELSEFEGEVD